MILLDNLNLIDLLYIIRQNKLSELRSLWDQNSDIFKTLETLKVITIISSDSNLKIELTPIGSSIQSNDEIVQSMKTQEVKLNTIQLDLQRIKSSLSAISLDVLRSKGIVEENPYPYDFLIPKDQGLNSVSEKKKLVSNPDEPVSLTAVTNFEEFKSYVQEKRENLKPSDLQVQKRALKRIKNTYSKIFEYLQFENYQEFGMESFILLDSIFIFLLQFFDQRDPNILTLPLEKKYILVKNLPIKIDQDLILFLDRFNSDILNKTEEPLKIGEKTANKLVGLLNDIYKPFISVFEELT